MPPAARNDALCTFFDASPPMTENHFPPRSASQRKVERLSGGSSRKLSPTVRSGARAGDSAHHEEASYGRCERGVDLHPLHRGWGRADCTSGAAIFGGGSDRLGHWSGDRTAPSLHSVIPAGPVQPSFVQGCSLAFEKRHRSPGTGITAVYSWTFNEIHFNQIKLKFDLLSLFCGETEME